MNVTTSAMIWSEEDQKNLDAPHVRLKAYSRIKLQRLMSHYKLKFDAETTTGDEMKAALIAAGVDIPEVENYIDFISAKDSKATKTQPKKKATSKKTGKPPTEDEGFLEDDKDLT